jgi:hypothetical protein
VQSQIKYHQLNPNNALIFIKPRVNEMVIQTKDILEMIETEGSSIALILLSGVHYYTGQLFQMEQITKAAHEKVIFTSKILSRKCEFSNSLSLSRVWWDSIWHMLSAMYHYIYMNGELILRFGVLTNI